MILFRRFVVIAALGALLLSGYLLAQEINLVKLHVDSFTIAGISTRTSNATESASGALIPAMWQRFSNENLLTQIPNRVDDRVYALYTDYTDGKDGMYTYILGAKVSSTKNLPAEFVARKVASGQYAMFTEQGGPPPQMVVNLWRHIWSLEKPGGLQRAYKTDYEVHYGSAEDAAKSKVDVYVGLFGK